MKRRNFKFVIYIIIGIFIISMVIPSLRRPISSGLGYVTNPIISSLTKAGKKFGSFFSVVGKIKKLSKENSDLKNELSGLKSKNLSCDVYKNENSDLKKQLNYLTENQISNFATAKVLYNDPSKIQSYLTIGLGNKDNIKKDMPVISQGYLIGSVIDVYHNYSKVLMITSPNSSFSAYVMPSNTLGLVNGQLGFGMTINSLPREIKINSGDSLITSGMGIYPKGLIVGQIKEITSSKNDVFQRANVEPLIDFSKLEFVSILKGENQ